MTGATMRRRLAALALLLLTGCPSLESMRIAPLPDDAHLNRYGLPCRPCHHRHCNGENHQ